MNFIKDVIYSLKRDYGFPVILYNVLRTNFDLDTGKKRQTIQFKNVAKAVLLPTKQFHATYKDGPIYNPNDRELFVDYCNFEIKVGTQVIYENIQYNVIEVNIFERNVAYILKIRAIEGVEALPEIGSAVDTFIFNQELIHQHIKYASPASNIIIFNQIGNYNKYTRHTIIDPIVFTDEAPEAEHILPINRDLVVAYHLNETSGVRFDAVGSLDLTDVNTVGYTAGITGNASHHTKILHEYLSHADHANFRIGDNDWQTTFWFRLTTTAGNMSVFSKYDGSPDYAYAIYFASGDKLDFRAFQASGGQKVCYANTVGNLVAATWYFVSAKHDAVNNKLGISINNGPWDEIAFADGGVLETDADFMVGGLGFNAAYYLNGDVDALHIWKGRLLTAGELTYMYNGGAGREIS